MVPAEQGEYAEVSVYHDSGIIPYPAFYPVQETVIKPLPALWHCDTAYILHIPAVRGHAGGGIDGCIVGAYVISQHEVERCNAFVRRRAHTKSSGILICHCSKNCLYSF